MRKQLLCGGILALTLAAFAVFGGDRADRSGGQGRTDAGSQRLFFAQG